MKVDGITEMNNKESKSNSKTHSKPAFKATMTLPKELYQWIEGNSPQAILIWNSSNELIFTTSSVERHLGYKYEEMKGLKWTELMKRNDIKYFERKVLSLSSGETTSSTIKLPHRDGRNKWFLWTISKQISEGEIYYISLLQILHDKEDIDDLYIKNEKLAVVSQLAASVVHEIRNPLTSLKGFIQLLESGIGNKEEYFRIMNEEIEKMEAMTSELLFISKPPVNEKAWESVQSMLNDVTMLLNPEARKKKASIVWKQSQDEIKVYCNRSQIKQVFLNLIKNAIEAIDHDHGIIEIKLEVLSKHVVISFIDNGPGVPENIIDRLGEPFLTTKENGTGLGLMVTKQLMSQHGGEMKVVPNEKEGTTFKLRIPIVPHEKNTKQFE
ncbi:PAS domain-containing sensor histidine kinase [Aciduricibacillus chroicocephali]|uniref:histidine kinase n=1 Tax=Aciduricibacillus chroicocephali TaxID=3054939 RepID=A0ABY9KYB5_9BACI|nr:PAS domain-containing sensor histidine kinase [Bacillaceae bacterium 44XB]